MTTIVDPEPIFQDSLQDFTFLKSIAKKVYKTTQTGLNEDILLSQRKEVVGKGPDGTIL